MAFGGSGAADRSLAEPYEALRKGNFRFPLLPFGPRVGEGRLPFWFFVRSFFSEGEEEKGGKTQRGESPDVRLNSQESFAAASFGGLLESGALEIPPARR